MLMILDLFRVTGRVAVVTGAGRGLGAAAAVGLAEAGADVVISARSADQLASVAAQVGAAGRRALAVPADLSDLDAAAALAGAAVDAFGRLDIVVNNVGGAMPRPFAATGPAHLEAAFHFNVAVAHALTRAAVPYLLAAVEGGGPADAREGEGAGAEGGTGAGAEGGTGAGAEGGTGAGAEGGAAQGEGAGAPEGDGGGTGEGARATGGEPGGAGRATASAVINISSAVGRTAGRGYLAYGTAKAALAHYTRLAAADLAPRIRVNAIAVGAAATSALDIVLTDDGLRGQMERATPLRRIGDPREVAAAVVFLASPASGYITGKIMEVDGGIDRPNLDLGIPDL
jgi:NAD(P)-dependent dehydrogenase (short-subunit alcohol dehydrogenase family)